MMGFEIRSRNILILTLEYSVSNTRIYPKLPVFGSLVILMPQILRVPECRIHGSQVPIPQYFVTVDILMNAGPLRVQDAVAAISPNCLW